MALDLDVIRRIRIQASAEGFETVDRVLGNVATHMGDFGKAAAFVSQSFDRTQKGLLSAADAMDRLNRRVNPLSKELYNLQQDLRKVDLYLKQGGDPAFAERVTQGLLASTTAAKELQANLAKVQEAMRLGTLLGADTQQGARIIQSLRDDIQGAAEDADRFAAKMQQAMRFRDQARKENPFASHVEDFRGDQERRAQDQADAQKRISDEALVDRKMEEYAQKRLARAREHADFEKRQADQRRKELDEQQKKQDEIDAQWRRQRMEEATGLVRPVGSPSSTGLPNVATVSALQQREELAELYAKAGREQHDAMVTAWRAEQEEMERLKKKANEVLERINPIGQAIKRADEQLKELDRMVERGLLAPELLAEGQADVRRRLEHIQRSRGVGGADAGVNNGDVANLWYQVSDIFTMGAMGSNPFQILVTQGPQIAQILYGNRGGLVGGMKDFAQAMLSAITPARVLTGTLIAIPVTSLVLWNRYRDSINEIEKSLIGLGRSTRGTVADLEAIAMATADATDLSRTESRSLVATLAGTGRIDPSIYQEAGKAARDYALITGQELPEAGKELAAALADPAQGVLDLDKKFNLFNATQLRTIQRMAAAGDTTGAAKAILNGLLPVIDEASKKTSIWARAWNAVAEEASDAADKVGKALDRALSGPSLAEQLASAQEARRIIDQQTTTAGGNRRRAAALGPNGGSLEVERERLDAEITRLQRALEDEGARRLEEQMSAAANNLSKDIRALTEDWDPLQEQVDDFSDRIENLRRKLADPLTVRLDDKDIKRAEEGIKYYERARAQAERYQAAGGQQYYEANRSAQFALSITGLSDYARGLAEIDQRYEEQLETARATIKSTEDLAAAEKTLSDIREAERQTLRETTNRNTVREIAPEFNRAAEIVEALKNLRTMTVEDMAKAGTRPDQVRTAIQRLITEFENLQHPVERRIRDAELELEAIRATTFEQRAEIEARQAYNQVLDQTHDKLEAQTAMEIARARAIEQSNAQARETLRDARERAGLVGLNPFERGQRQIDLDYQRRIEQAAPSARPALEGARDLEKWESAQEAIRGPLKDVNDSLNDQIRLARVQAETFGRSTAEIETAAERQRLLNEYMRAGVQITPQLSANIEAYIQSFGRFKQAEQIIRDQQEAFTEYMGMMRDGVKGVWSDLREGKSLVEALTNAFNRMFDRIIDMMINSIFDPNGSQKGFNIFQMLFGGGPNRGSALPGLVANPFPAGNQTMPNTSNIVIQNATIPGVNLTPLQQGIDANIAGSLVPAITKASTSAVANASEATRSVVTDYIRQKASSLGINPDIAVRVARSEGLNVFDPSRGLNGAGDIRNGVPTSFGPFQLHYGGLAPGHAYNVRGMGDDFTRATGLNARDPSTWQQQIDFALGRAKEGGWSPWYGAGKAGISRWEGISRGAGDQRALLGGAGQNTMVGGTASDLAGKFDDLSRSTAQLTPNVNQFGVNMQSMTSQLSTAAPQMQQGLSQITNTVGQGATGVGDALQSTSNVITQSGNNVGNAFNSVVNSLNQASVSGAGKGLSGLFSLGGAGAGGGAYPLIDPITGVQLHLGGTVGSGGTPRTLSLMDQIALMSAPRLHTGTLRPDERYAVLQTGEKVLSRDDVAQARRNGQAAAPAQPNLSVNIIGAPSQPEVRQNQDGSVDVVFEQYEAWQADRAKRGRGSLVKAIGARSQGTALIG